MSRVKDIRIERIDSTSANAFVRQNHYSGKVVANSQLHLGAFLDGQLHGVMSFGPSMDKRKTMQLVEGTGWNEFIELNRMAFDDHLPRNSESRCLGIAMRLLRKHCPHVKWVISFADGAQCGDGTIYRSVGFLLTQINVNKSILEFPNGERIAGITLTANVNDAKSREIHARYGLKMDGSAGLRKYLDVGAKYVKGYQLRYIYLLDKSCKLKTPVLPYTAIDEVGAGMYRGLNVSIAERRLERWSGEVESNAISQLDTGRSALELSPRAQGSNGNAS